MAITSAPIRDIDIPLAGMLQEQGLRDIPPELWQMYLNQYMKDQQGVGNVLGAPFKELQAQLEAMAQLQGQDKQQQGPGGGVREYIGKGLDVGKKLTQQAEKAFGDKTTGRTEKTYQTQRTNERDASADKADRADTKPLKDEDEAVAGEGARTTNEAGAATTAANQAPVGASQAPIGAGVNEALPYNTAGQYGFTDPNFPGMTFPTKGFNEVGAPSVSGTPTLSFGGESWVAPTGLQESFDPYTAAMGRPFMDVPTPALQGGQGFDLGFDPTLAAYDELTGTAPAAADATSRALTGTESPGAISGMLGRAGGALGALGGAYGLYNAFAGEGSPQERALSGLSGGYGLYSGANTLAGTNLPTLQTALVNPVLEALSNIGTAAGSTMGTAGATTASGALTGAAPEILSGVGGYGAGLGTAGGTAAGGTAGATAGSTAGSVGAGTLGGAALATIMAPIIVGGLVNALTGEDKDPFAQVFGFAGKPEGYSKYVSGKRKAASGVYDTAYLQAMDALRNFQGTTGGGDLSKMSPDTLRQLGNELVGATASYYGTSPKSDQIGPSSHTVAPGSISPWNITGKSLAGVNQALMGMGQTPVDLGPLSNYTGIDRPSNWLQLEMNPQGALPSDYFMPPAAISPDWGTRGAPPDRGTSDYTNWLANKYFDYIGGPQLSPQEQAFASGLGSTGGGGGTTMPSAAQGGAGGALLSGGGSDPEKGLPGIATKNFQAALGTLPNPWAEKEASATLNPLDEAMEQARTLLAQG